MKGEVSRVKQIDSIELFRMLEGSGVVITEKYKGIYYLSGKVLFDTQKEPGKMRSFLKR